MVDGQDGEVIGTAQPTTTQEGSSQGAPDVSGLQQRINELTAKAHEAERRATEATTGFNGAMERLARLEGRLEAGGTAPAVQEFDYSVFGEAADPLKKALDRQAAQFQQQLAQMNGAMQAQLRRSEVATLCAQRGYPPVVAQRADELAAMWAAKGMPLIGSDAVKFALAEAVENGQFVPQAGKPGGRAMGAPPAGATLHGGTPPHVPQGAPPNGQPKGLVLPTNFEDMSPAQQQAFIQKNNIQDDFDV